MRTRLVAVTIGTLCAVGLPVGTAAGDAAGDAATGTLAGRAAPVARAEGAVPVGQTGTPLTCSPAGGTYVSKATGAAAPGYSVPGPGVLTSISHNANATPGSIRAVVMGPGPAPTNRTVLGYSALLAVTPSTLNTFPTRIPVPAGARLGMYATADNMG